MTTEQNHAVLSCAPSAFLAIPEPGELTLHRWKPTNPLTTQGAARSRSWYARQGRRLPDGTGCGCLRGSLQLPIEVTSTSSFLLLPHKAFDLLASILLGIDLFWSFIFFKFFFLLRVPGSDENDQCLLSMHGHRTGSLASQQSVLYKCKGVEELVFPSGFEQLLPHKKLLRVAAILEKLRQMTFLFFSHLYRKIHITTQQRTCVCLVRVSMQIQRPLANSLFGQQFCPRPFPWASELFLKTK